MKFKTIITTALTCAALCFGVSNAAAATEPWTGTIKLVVPYPPGGSTDNLARLFAERMTAELGQVVVIDNRGGAGGTIGAQAVARSNPDGSTLLLAPTAVMTITPYLRTVPYDPIKDFVSISKLASTIGIVAVPKDFPANNMQEFIAYAKAHAGDMTYGSAGLGTVTHLQAAALLSHLGLSALHVPYKGSGPAMNDLMAGRIDMMFDSIVLTQVKNGQLKGLAAKVDARHPDLPNVPTLKEQGIDIELPSWYGLYAPAGTPKAVVDRYAAAAKKIMADPGLQAQLLALSQQVTYLGPADFVKSAAADTKLYRTLIKEANIKMD